MDKWNQQLFDVIGRSRNVSARVSSKAASVQEEEMVTISLKEYNELLNQRQSKASISTTESVRLALKEYRELLINKAMRKSKAASISAPSGINKAKIIYDFLNRR